MKGLAIFVAGAITGYALWEYRDRVIAKRVVRRLMNQEGGLRDAN